MKKIIKLLERILEQQKRTNDLLEKLVPKKLDISLDGKDIHEKSFIQASLAIRDNDATTQE